MRKSVVLILFSIVLITSISLADEIFSEKYLLPIDISGKILDQDGKLFTDKVILHLRTETVTKEQEEMGDYSGTEKIYEQEVSGGYFNWKGRATSVDVSVIKEGYYSAMVSPRMTEAGDSFEIKADDILIYLIQKGIPSTLEYTGDAKIPISKSGKTTYGWSFKKRWYFPVKEEDTDIIFTVDEKDRNVYTMKEPGGFILFPGYPKFESKLDEVGAGLGWMTQAPESGYVQTIIPEEDMIKNKTQYRTCYYFRTPDGKYGKLTFGHSGDFDYYLQPDGSRNLEVEKRWFRPPRNPKAVPRTDDPQAYPLHE